MHLIILSLLALPLLAVTQSTQPACVQSCFSAHPSSSWCDGDETGDALDTCTCTGLSYATAMLSCIKKCPTADQEKYAATVPERCRSELLPGVKAAAVTSKATETATVTGTATGGAQTAAAGRNGVRYLAAAGVVVAFVV